MENFNIENFGNYINDDWFNSCVSSRLLKIETGKEEAIETENIGVEIALLYSFYITYLKKMKKPLSEVLRGLHYDIDYLENKKVLTHSFNKYRNFEKNESLLKKILNIIPKNVTDEETRGIKASVVNLGVAGDEEIDNSKSSKNFLLKAIDRIPTEG